jgi:hypothetical protein
LVRRQIVTAVVWHLASRGDDDVFSYIIIYTRDKVDTD